MNQVQAQAEDSLLVSNLFYLTFAVKAVAFSFAPGDHSVLALPSITRDVETSILTISTPRDPVVASSWTKMVVSFEMLQLKPQRLPHFRIWTRLHPMLKRWAEPLLCASGEPMSQSTILYPFSKTSFETSPRNTVCGVMGCPKKRPMQTRIPIRRNTSR